MKMEKKTVYIKYFYSLIIQRSFVRSIQQPLQEWLQKKKSYASAAKENKRVEARQGQKE